MSVNYLAFVLLLLALGAATAVTAIAAMAIALLRPPRMTDGKAVWVLRRMSPGDLGLRFEDVQFKVRDERTGDVLRLVGWWIPNPAAAGKCVVLLHGYADAKVGAIAWAPLWHAMGFNVLAIDLRAHGESDGAYCTAGYWERHDLCQVLDQLRAERAPDTRQIVLFGVSLGAATAAATAVMRDDIAAVVLESPPADFRAAAMSHMDHLGAPGRMFQVTALSVAQRIAGCNFAAVRPVALLGQIHCPVMIISPSDDLMVGDVARMAIQESLESRNRPHDDVYWPVDTRNMLALHSARDEYDVRLRDFLHAMIGGMLPASGLESCGR